MQDDETWTESDEYDYIYFRLWLFEPGAGNRNGLRWLYDDE